MPRESLPRICESREKILSILVENRERNVRFALWLVESFTLRNLSCTQNFNVVHLLHKLLPFLAAVWAWARKRGGDTRTSHSPWAYDLVRSFRVKKIFSLHFTTDALPSGEIFPQLRVSFVLWIVIVKSSWNRPEAFAGRKFALKILNKSEVKRF